MVSAASASGRSGLLKPPLQRLCPDCEAVAWIAAVSQPSASAARRVPGALGLRVLLAQVLFLRRATTRLAVRRRKAPLEDGHRRAAAAALERGSLGRLHGARRRHEHQQPQQRDQTLAVRVQEAMVARAAQSLGQHVTHHQPRELGAADRTHHRLAAWRCARSRRMSLRWTAWRAITATAPSCRTEAPLDIYTPPAYSRAMLTVIETLLFQKQWPL
jgi:hypothetical protein